VHGCGKLGSSAWIFIFSMFVYIIDDVLFVLINDISSSYLFSSQRRVQGLKLEKFNSLTFFHLKIL
jgi:hypothetical protein